MTNLECQSGVDADGKDIKALVGNGKKDNGEGWDNGTIQNFDDLLDYLGTGRWSVLYFIIGSVFNGCFAMQALSGAFSAPIMNYTCSYPDSSMSPAVVQDSQMTYIINITTITPRDECTYEVNSTRGGVRVEQCTQWDFDHSIFGNTITSEMSLVCERSFFVPLYQSVYMFGSVIGASLGGLLSDKLGRNPVFVMTAALLVLLGSGMALLSNIYLILAARVGLGFLHTSSIQSSYVLVMETTTSHARPMVGMLVMLPWALGIAVYGVLGYAIRDWRYLQLSTTLPFLLLFPGFFLLDESPRWLLVRGEIKKVLKVVNKAARWQKVSPISLETMTRVMNNQKKQNEAEQIGVKVTACKWIQMRALDLVVLFRTSQLCILTIVVCINFFTSSMVYYGLSLSAVSFSTDPFVFMTLSGLAEVPSYVLTGPILAKVGRKAPAMFGFLVTGLSLVALPFIPLEADWLRVTLAMVGKLCISSVFVEFFLYSSEVFPTEVRLQGLGTGLLFSRCGSIISPFINDILVPVYPWMTSVVFGGFSIVAGLSTFLLPETKGVRIPDVVADIEHTISLPYKAGKQMEVKLVSENETKVTLTT